MKKILVFCLSLMMAAGMVMTSPVYAKQSYSAIYSTYKKKLNKAGKKAVKDYKRKAKGTKNVNKMASIANNQVTKLATVMTNGGTKMASYMYASDMNYDRYQKWYMKLYNVYNKQAMKVYNAYNKQYINSQSYLSSSQKKQMLNSLKQQEKATLEASKQA